MLTSTYIHIRGISPKCERSLWEQGALSWGDFLAKPKSFITERAEIAKVKRAVENSVHHLEVGDFQYFAQRLPRREHWRAFPEFRDTAVYLDIETDGGNSDSSITVIGLYDGVTFTPYVKGENLQEFEDAISKSSTIVTFFGTGFDLPVMQRQFPNVLFDHLHIDLCTALRRIGYRGGLKAIERQFGIERSERTQGLTGRDAVYLWRKHLRGDSNSYELLIEYNREDVVNLERLMEAAYFDLREFTMG